jgi:hypothetical protein
MNAHEYLTSNFAPHGVPLTTILGEKKANEQVVEYFQSTVPNIDKEFNHIRFLSVTEILRLREFCVPEMLLWEMYRFPVFALEPNHDVYCFSPESGEVFLVPASACLEEPYRLYDWEDEEECPPTLANLTRIALQRFQNSLQFLNSIQPCGQE